MKGMKNRRTNARQARGADATATLLSATLKLGETVGFDTLTMEGISEHTGVAKTTLYRRWPNVYALVMEAFLDEVTRAAPIKEKPTARESFSSSMKLLAGAYRARQGKILQAMIGRIQTDAQMREAVKTRWVEPRRKIAREIIKRGVASGEIRPDVDPDVVLDTLYGAMYHRLMIPYNDATLSDSFVEAVVDTVFRGVAVKKESR